MISERASQQAFLGTSALLFAGSTALTIAWCASMSAMGTMAMPGGWTVSMAWMRMPGQTWEEATASFVGMWMVMMAAMMLPSLVPMLWRYRQSAPRTTATRLNGLTALASLGYFSVWTALGVVVFPLGAAVTAMEMEQPALARAIPVAAGVVVLGAGVLQFTRWKAHQLAGCREEQEHNCALRGDAKTAWWHGLGFGISCVLSCANLTAVLLVVGVMDLRAMAAVTAAITAERLAPGGRIVTRAIGVVVVAKALVMILRALVIC